MFLPTRLFPSISRHSLLLSCKSCSSVLSPSSRNGSRKYHTSLRAVITGKDGSKSSIRIPLGSPKVIGTAVSRGPRYNQEDSHQFAALSLNPEELRLSANKFFDVDWDPSLLQDDALARQLLYVGIFDGHGGSAVSLYLHQHLHGLVEAADASQIPEIFAWMSELGGYFKRHHCRALSPWCHPRHDPHTHGVDGSSAASTNSNPLPPMDLEARMTLAFLDADRVLSEGHEAKTCGATASVALLHSLDIPQTPFYAAEKLGLTVAHCGDTRVLLCSTDGGRPFRMTQDHHADARGEASRLRRVQGSGLITDSFGEAKWMGAVTNTRSLGDLKYKPHGVTAEPEVKTKLLHGPDWAYMIMVTDGISSVVSDSEIVDLARSSHDPKAAANAILSFAEDMGSEDNATVIVVSLAGWGKVRGSERSKALREYRIQQAVGAERLRRM